VPFGAAHAPSLAFFVFAGPDGLHRLKYLPVKVGEPLGGFVFGPEHGLDEEALEQPGGDVADAGDSLLRLDDLGRVAA